MLKLAMKCLKNPLKGWQRKLAIFLPFLLLPLPIVAQTKASCCAYVLAIMSVLWMTEALPVSVTSLIPLVMFPLFGISKNISQYYFDEANAMLLGSLIAATAVEISHLHNRIALKVLLWIGVEPKRLLLGMMLTPAILSMWISNSATAVLMVPIAEGILSQLHVEENDDFNRRKSIISLGTVEMATMNATGSAQTSIQSQSTSNEPSLPNEDETSKKLLKKAIFLGICYSANIGGTGSITGSPPNLILKGVLERKYPNYNGINFNTWLLFNAPIALILVLITWICFHYAYMRHIKTDPERNKQVRETVQLKYKALGPMTFHEMSVLFLFTLLLLLWFFRDPGFIPGWGHIAKGPIIKDSAAAFAVIIMMFIVPRNLKNWREGPALLDWKTAETKVPWGIFLLVGGSIALSEGVQSSGLAAWLSGALSGLETLPVALLIIFLCIVALFLTEIMSNTAATSVLLSILPELANSLKIHPVLLMLPVTICCSYAFMLPVAAGPNAIVSASAGLTAKDMALPGVVMKIICTTVLLLGLASYGLLIFNFNTPIN